MKPWISFLTATLLLITAATAWDAVGLQIFVYPLMFAAGCTFSAMLRSLSILDNPPPDDKEMADKPGSSFVDSNGSLGSWRRFEN
jgi:hypothetical protein